MVKQNMLNFIIDFLNSFIIYLFILFIYRNEHMRGAGAVERDVVVERVRGRRRVVPAGANAVDAAGGGGDAERRRRS